MIVIDRKFVKAFLPNERLVVLTLLVDAEKDGFVEYKEGRLVNSTGLTINTIQEILLKLSEDGVIEQYDNKIRILDFESYKVQEKSSKNHLKTESTNGNLKERAHDFGQTLIPFLVSYPKEMIRAFYNYWTEPNKSHTKMRFEMQKTWEVGRRLATWANNNKNFGNNNYGRETATDRLKRTFNEANEFRNQLAAQREADLEAGDS